MDRFARLDRSTGALVLSAAGAFLGFLLFYRYYIPQGDDLRFTAQLHHPYGAFTSDLWWHFWDVDYHTISGRTATVLGMLMMHPGVRFVRVLAPAICAWLVFVAGGLLRDGRRPDGAMVAGLAGASVLPVTLVTNRSLNGDVLAWCMSFANYVLPTAALMTVALVLLRRLEVAGGMHGRVGWPMAIAGLVLALLAPTLHEDTALGMVALAAGCALVARRQLGALGWSILVLGLAGSAEMLSAPGLRAHLNYSNGAVPSGESGLLLRAHRLADGCCVLLSTTWAAFLVLTVGMALLLVRSTPCATGGEPSPVDRRTRLLALVSVASALVALAAGHHWRMWQHRGFTRRLTAGGIGSMVVLLASMLALVILLLVMAWRLRTRMGVRLFVVLVTALGCSAPAVVSGVSTPRAYSQGALWITLTAWLTVLALTPQRRAVRFRSAVAALCVFVCAWWLVTGVLAMRTNMHRWQPIARQMAHAAATRKPARVEVPLLLPEPNYQFNHGFDLKIYRNYMLAWYAMPHGSELVQI